MGSREIGRHLNQLFVLPNRFVVGVPVEVERAQVLVVSPVIRVDLERLAISVQGPGRLIAVLVDFSEPPPGVAIGGFQVNGPQVIGCGLLILAFLLVDKPG